MNTKATNVSILPIFITIFIDLVGLGIIIPVIAPLLLNPMDGILPASMSMEQKTFILGLLIASFPIAQFFGAPVLGAMSDRYGRKPILQISLVGTMLGYLLFAIGVAEHNLYILFAARMLDGFTGGNIAIIQSSISDISSAENRSRNFGLIGMAFGLGFILGPYIGGKFSEPGIVSSINNATGLSLQPLATPFWVATILALVNILLVQFQFKETLHAARHTPISPWTGFVNIRKAMKLEKLRILFAVSFLVTLGFNFYTQFFNVYLIEKFYFTTDQIGDYFALIGICVALAQGIVVRPVSKRLQAHQILRFSLFVLGCGLLMQVFPTESYQLYWAMPVIAIGQGLTQPNTNALISRQAGPSHQGEIFGVTSSITSVAFAIPPIISGLITNINVHLPIVVGGTCVLLGWSIFISLPKSRWTGSAHS